MRFNQEVLGYLQEIVTHVHTVNEVMGEVATASDQQQQGVSEFNSATDQRNQVAQQTAACAEQSAKTAKILSEQAPGTPHLVKTFQLSSRPPRSLQPLSNSRPLPQAHAD